MRALFIKHDHNSPGGLVGEAFTGLGYDITELTVVPAERFHSPGVSFCFPDPAGYDAVVAFGAVWSVYDDAAIGTWIHDEIAFTQAAIAAGVPLLGICFGGQVLAAAIGGRVERAPVPELGWTLIDTRAPGLIDAGPWLQWHYDRFILPAGVPAIATTAVSDQAFAVGRSLGLQFHPEVTESVLDGWLSFGGASELTAAGVDPGRLLADARSLASGAAARTRQLVRGFVRDVATRPIATPSPGTVVQ
jgi:GMP synthase-like glutamine amidotransferase